MASLVQRDDGTAQKAGSSSMMPEEHDNDPEAGDGTANSSARRPMNAFLIFCKHHRSMVREKYPHLENRSVTKILGEWWANLEPEEKSTYTDLAKQYKEAFMKANPDFKWYKLPSAPTRTLVTRPSNQRPPKSDAWKTEIEGSSDSVNSITPGKLADETQLGGLSSLFAFDAGQQPNEISQMSKPPKKRYLQNLQNGDLHDSSHGKSQHKVPSFTSDSARISPAISVPDNKTSSACSALLKLAEMCSSKEYSNVDGRSNTDNSKAKIKKDVEKNSTSVFNQQSNVTNSPTTKLSPKDSLSSVSCDSDEPLDLCTEKVKKIKTSHIIDHFVSKFLCDSLCANPDRTRKSSLKDLPNNIQSDNLLVQNKLNTFLANGQFTHRVPSESFVQNNCLSFKGQNVDADDYSGRCSDTSSSKYSQQSSVCSTYEPADFEINDFKTKSNAEQLSPPCSGSSKRVRTEEEHAETSSRDSNASSLSDKLSQDSDEKLIKLPMKRRNYSDSGSSTSDEPPAKKGNKAAKQKTSEQPTIVCGTLVVSQLFSGFREAPNSKACDLFSKAIHSVIDNAYDNNQEGDLKIKKLFGSKICDKSPSPEGRATNIEKDDVKSNCSDSSNKSRANVETPNQRTSDDDSNDELTVDESGPTKASETETKSDAKCSGISPSNRAKRGETSRRKSPRASKGKRYQELTSIGAIHLPKERTNFNFVGSSVGGSKLTVDNNNDDDEETPAAVKNEQPSPPLEKRQKSPTKSNDSRPSSSEFNLDEHIAALPKCNMQLFECKRWRRKHLSGDESSTSYSCIDKRFNSDTDPSKDPDFRPSQAVIRRIRRHSESSNRISFNSWLPDQSKLSRFKTGDFDLEAEIAALPKCNINILNQKRRNKRRNVSAPSGQTIESADDSGISLLKKFSKDDNGNDKQKSDSNDASTVTGSRKRKFRRKSITHLESGGVDKDTGSEAIENASLVTLAEVASSEQKKLRK